MAHQYAQGTLIWIKDDEEVWKQAEIVTSNDKEIIVKSADQPNDRITLGPNEPIFLRTSDVFTSEGLSVLDDLTQLTHLHEPAVLSSLQNRFDIDKIYTFTGPILIALNPFKTIPGLYEDEVLQDFLKSKEQKPHVFTTSRASYRGVCDRMKSQTVLISGESGAGKTETTKFVMKFLALAGSTDGQVTNVEKQVLESNPLLEAFGNARTLRNDNSSRFGKFIEMQFEAPGKESQPAAMQTGVAGASMRLCGARIQTYLLEKVRVCDQQEGERNYHIFYEGCAAFSTLGGASTYKFPTVLPKEKYTEFEVGLEGFADLGNFAYLTRSTCRTLAGVDDVEMFERRIAAMQTIGISTTNISNIFKVVAMVLNLGNTKFDAPPNNSEGSMVMRECDTFLQACCDLTGVERKSLEYALCNQTRTTRTETIRSPVNVRTAAENRDALARALYGMVFNFIVDTSNKSIGYKDSVKLFIGVLDIFGFECFKMNSFEQLCINFTNERLQQFFNQFVFKLEEQIYEREGIPWDPLDFPDNQDAVDLLQAKTTGVFSILDEECVVPAGSDQGFCNKLMKAHKGHRRFDEIKTKPTWFVIKHFAGPVNYCSDTFLDKNKDQLSNDIVECMSKSTNEFIVNMFVNDERFNETLQGAVAEAPAGKKKKKYSVSSEFKEQLSNLMDIVDTTEPHFIRCIKPNPQNLPDLYDRKGVTEQLRYGGVLQVVQVSRAGYPVRINHQEAWDDYRVIASAQVVKGLRHVDDLKVRAQKLLEHLATEFNLPKPAHGGATWAVGKTMVFFKQQAYERLKFARLELLIRSCTLIQACWRRKVRMRIYKAIRMCTRHLQAMVRVKEARMDLRTRQSHKSATKIQALYRGNVEKKKYSRVLAKLIKLQAWRRGVTGRRFAKDFRLHKSATKIQSAWRRYKERRVYLALRKSIYIAQQRLRVRSAKKQMKQLKQEAKEVGALMTKTTKAQQEAQEMRKRNEELESHHLQLNSEKKSMQAKAKQMEETLQEKLQELEEVKKQTEEAVKQAANSTQTVVETEELNALNQQLEDKDAELKKLEEELEAMKEAQTKQAEQLAQAENRYQQLLKSTAMQSMSSLGQNAGAGAGSAMTRFGSKLASNRNVDIQIVGAQGVGKTSLLETLIKECDESQLAKFQEQKPYLMTHHQLKVGERPLKILDCSGNQRAAHLVKEWFVRSVFVIVVYDMTNKSSFEHALEVAKEVNGAGAKVVLFGNKYSVNDEKPVQVDVMAAKDCAVRNEGMAMESAQLIDAVRVIVNAIEHQEQPNAEGSLDGMSPDRKGSNTLTAAIDSMKSWFGGTQSTGGRSNAGVLRPSLKGTKAMKQKGKEGDLNDLRPVQELQDSESAVTCICFGQEKLHKSYVLLATASKDGTVVIYRCYRTEMEIAMTADTDFPQDDDSAFSSPPADHSNIAVHSRLVGHTRAITSIFLNLLEDQLVTTSIDKSVRFWGVESGEMLKVFTDSSAVPVATFLPFNPSVFVAANSNAVLRLVNVTNGMVLQKLKVETEVRALKFDDTGLFLFAGTKNGSIHVLEASDSNTLKFKFKVQLARGGVTCITFVPACHGQPPCLLVNTSDSSATIINCSYGPARGVLNNLSVRHRVRVAHSLLPLKCCYSPSGHGYLITGSEDKEVYIYPLAKGANYKMQYLKHHQVPVVAVAVNLQDTLLASADSLGRIVLWRRMDFSHLQD